MTGVDLDALFEQHALVVEGLHGKDAVLGDIGGVAYIGDFLALIGHVFRQGYTHEMPVAIEDQYALTRHGLTRRDLEGPQPLRPGMVATRNRSQIGPPSPPPPL